MGAAGARFKVPLKPNPKAIPSNFPQLFLIPSTLASLSDLSTFSKDYFLT